jgi:hypothetical protein
MNLNLWVVNLLNLVVLGNVKCGINVYGCMLVMIVGDEFLSTWGSSKRSRARYIFWTLLWNIDLLHVLELYSVHVTLANLCITRSGMMHLALSCEVHRSRIFPFGHPKNGGHCVHIWFLTWVPTVHDFENVTPLFSVTPISDVWLENSKVMLPKLQTEGTRARTRAHATTTILGWV